MDFTTSIYDLNILNIFFTQFSAVNDSHKYSPCFITRDTLPFGMKVVRRDEKKEQGNVRRRRWMHRWRDREKCKRTCGCMWRRAFLRDMRYAYAYAYHESFSFLQAISLCAFSNIASLKKSFDFVRICMDTKCSELCMQNVANSKGKLLIKNTIWFLYDMENRINRKLLRTIDIR